MSGLRIHLFSSLKVYVFGELAKLKLPPKTIPMWAYLLMHSGQPVSRQKLAFTIWPDANEGEARANLRRHLYHLQHALPPAPSDCPWLVSDAETIRWNDQSDFWLDVAEFERLSSSPETTAQAVELYTGDFLEDQYDDWIFYPREHFRNLYIVDLQRLIQHFWSKRDYPKAITFVSRLLALDPFREDAFRQLMALRYESGDRSGALGEYERFVHRLRQELDVDPMPETLALYETIFRDTGITARETTDEENAPLQKKDVLLRLPFVGRDLEIEEMKTWWSRTVRRQGRLAMIGGEAGVGKTRLVEEFAHTVETQGGRVLRGTALPFEQIPYQAIVTAMRSALPMLAALEIDPHSLAAVATLIPELRTRCTGQRKPLPVFATVDPDVDRARLYEAIAVCMEGLAGPRPMLLILEDLHWAGAGTLSVLEYIVQRLANQPMLILVTYRQEEAWSARTLAEFRRQLQRQNLLAHLALERLSATAVTHLILQLAGESPESLAIAQKLFNDSDGNPFFLQEVIRSLLEAGVIMIEAGRWIVREQVGEAIPDRISSIINGRIARLSPRSRTLVEIAAVAGPAFDVELVCQVSGWSESQVLDSLDELFDLQVVREAISGSRFDYTFTHDLIQSTIYESIPQVSRKRRHRRVAYVLEAFRSAQLEDLAPELAVHFDRGEEPERAAAYYLISARRALSVFADGEALSAIGRALELTPDPHLRVKLLSLREEIWHRQGEREAQLLDLVSLQELAYATGEEDWICENLRRQIRYRRALGDRKVEGELIAALKGRAAASGAKHWQAETLRDEATHQILLSQYDAASEKLFEALVLFQSLDDVHGQIACYCASIEIAVQRSQFDEAQEQVKKALLLAEGTADQSLLVGPLRTASAVAFARQEYQTSLALAQQMLNLCRAIGNREGEADALSRLGAIQARLFLVQQALQSYEQATVLYDRLGKRQGQAAVRLNAGILGVNLGRYEEAIASFRRAGELFASMDDLRGQMLSALNLSAPAIYMGDYLLASQAAQRGLDLARQLQIPVVEAVGLGNLGECRLHLGDIEGAIRYLEAALAMRRERSLPPGDSAADLSVLTKAYRQAGEYEKARQAAAELLALCDGQADSIPYPQQALLAVAQTEAALGDLDRAKKLLVRAYRIVQERAAAIPEPESRGAFLHMPLNRDVLTAYENGLL